MDGCHSIFFRGSGQQSRNCIPKQIPHKCSIYNRPEVKLNQAYFLAYCLVFPQLPLCIYLTYFIAILLVLFSSLFSRGLHGDLVCPNAWNIISIRRVPCHFQHLFILKLHCRRFIPFRSFNISFDKSAASKMNARIFVF